MGKILFNSLYILITRGYFNKRALKFALKKEIRPKADRFFDRFEQIITS